MQKGHQVVLADIADQPLAKAEARAKALGFSDRFTTAQCDLSFGKLPLADASFDVVYSRLALHYFESKVLSELFAEVHRILRPGGLAYLTLKSPDDAAELAFLTSTAQEVEDGVFDENGRIKTRYPVERLQQILTDAAIPPDRFDVTAYTEALGNANDIVKSGNDQFIVNQVAIQK